MQDKYKSKEPLWVDGFLVMVINSQEDMLDILYNSLSSIDASCSERILSSHLVLDSRE
jgi:hypothetical protein